MGLCKVKSLCPQNAKIPLKNSPFKSLSPKCCEQLTAKESAVYECMSVSIVLFIEKPIYHIAHSLKKIIILVSEFKLIRHLKKTAVENDRFGLTCLSIRINL